MSHFYSHSKWTYWFFEVVELRTLAGSDKVRQNVGQAAEHLLRNNEDTEQILFCIFMSLKIAMILFYVVHVTIELRCNIKLTLKAFKNGISWTQKSLNEPDNGTKSVQSIEDL